MWRHPDPEANGGAPPGRPRALRLRRFDAAGLRAYAQDLRPRLLTLRLRVKGLDLRWAVPLWAVEEIVVFALKLAPLLPVLARYAPDRVRRNFSDPDADPEAFDIGGFLEGLFSDEGRDALRLPPGKTFVTVETTDALIEISQI